MPQFKAPLRDIRFLMNDVFDFAKHYQRIPQGQDASPDVVDALLDACARFCEEELSPLNHSGDKEGCQFENGKVSTPKGFKRAYDLYVQGGWQGLSVPEQYGGQGLPLSLGVVKSELIGTANWSWGMYPGLSLGAMNTLFLHGSDAQKELYLSKLTAGVWSGTMCLTEPQCGTDLGQVKTRAELNADGSYNISGTKIFISAGEHDLTEQIIHIVLARLPDAPAGTKGISLFIVPKFQVNADGSLGAFNNVSCGAIEKKMGIHGSSTCVMNFDNAKGYLLGPENKGLNCMFTFMNTARIGTSIQGIGAMELSFQGALPYARERLSMRAISGTKFPEKIADPLIVHPDVRRMLLTQKAFAEGGRAILYQAAIYADLMMAAHAAGDENTYQQYDDLLGFMTPILKACLTEWGLEAANHGMQVYGGHGFIKEWGMEQIVRDTRIAILYEGTTGVQALDLLGRKMLLQRGKSYKLFMAEVQSFLRSYQQRKEMARFIRPLKAYLRQWRWNNLRIALKASRDRDMVGAASVDYLMYSGYIMLAFFWSRIAEGAYKAIARGEGDADFYRAKIQTAEFYFTRLLPRADAHASMMLQSPKTLMQMDAEHFAFA